MTNIWKNLTEKIENEEGEVSSWLILAAGLCGAAAIAVPILTDTIQGLAEAVG